MRTVIAVYRFAVPDDVTMDDVGQITDNAYAQIDDAVVIADTDGNERRVPTSDLTCHVVLGDERESAS